MHSCPTCGYPTDRDVAAAQIIEQRGVKVASYRVSRQACDDRTAVGGTVQAF